jgi:hypothetical protein
MVINNYSKLNKITLVGWDVNKPLDQTLPKHNIKYGFKVTKIWLLNLRVMNNNLFLNEMHITLDNRKARHLAQKNLGLAIYKANFTITPRAKRNNFMTSFFKKPITTKQT